MNKSVLTVNIGRPLLPVLELCYSARLSPLLIGGTGLGKSTILEQFAQEKGIGYLCRDLSLMEPPDLVGMPQIIDGRTQFCPPSSLPTDGEGLLVLEEINRAPEYMRAPCLQLLTARCLNDYRLPDGWLPVACINPAEDGYQAAELDPALLSRFVQIVVRPDCEEWVFWARKQGVHEKVIAYVRSDPTVFDSPTSNPRSWAHVSRLLQAGQQLKTDSASLRAVIAGCVGVERATSFFGYIRDGIEPLTPESVLDSYRHSRRKVRAWVEEGRLEFVEGTLLSLEKYLQSSTDFHHVRNDKSRWKNLGRFLEDLPGDLFQKAKEFFKDHSYPLPSANGSTK